LATELKPKNHLNFRARKETVPALQIGTQVFRVFESSPLSSLHFMSITLRLFAFFHTGLTAESPQRMSY
jgi:hypothetical protein